MGADRRNFGGAAVTARKLWKTVQGWKTSDGVEHDKNTEARPESKAEVYDICVWNFARDPRSHNVIDVFVDERDGAGWELYERISLADYYDRTDI